MTANDRVIVHANASTNGKFAETVFGKGTVQAALVSQGEMIARRLYRSLKIMDWGLFYGKN